jgi:p-aminobenzoyl-glutamate transporter AbgT
LRISTDRPLRETRPFSPRFVLDRVPYAIEATKVDSSRPFTPLMAYFPLIRAYAQRYDMWSGIGTVMALMIPFSITFFHVLTAFLLVWFLSGLPLAPGAGLSYAPATH